MTLFEKLAEAGLPVISVSANNEITMATMTPEQAQLYSEVLLEFYNPVEYAGIVAERLERQNFKNELQAVYNTLDAIINEASPTNQQVVNAVKFMATILKKIIKFIVKSLL